VTLLRIKRGAPALADSDLRLPTGVDPPLDAWTGGYLTAEQAQWARDRLKSTAQNQAARQLPDLSIIIRVDPSSPGVLRLRGALPKAAIWDRTCYG